MVSDEHISKLYEQIHALDKRVALVEDTMKELTEIKEDVHSIKTMFEQGRGAFKTIQFLIWIVGPLSAFIFWLIDHK